MKTNTIKYFLYLAIVLFIISSAYHVLTYIPLRTSNELVIFLSAVGTLSVFTIAIKSNKKHTENSEPTDIWKNALKGSPKWLKVSIIPLIGYVFFNFFFSLMVLKSNHNPDFIEGKYVLRNKKKIVREITEEEYWKQKAYEFRGMSGHTLLFQYLALILLGRKKRKQRT